MFNSPTISSLVWSLNKDQRQEFITLMEKFKEDGLDKILEKNDTHRHKLSCDSIIEDVISTTEYEERQAKKEEAVKEGKSTIPKEKWGVHNTHCCAKHGCKYGDSDCPVEMKLSKQVYPCESCGNDFEEKIHEYENSFNCNECGEDKKEGFTYDRTVSNGEIWNCKNCKTELVTPEEPNEDKF